MKQTFFSFVFAACAVAAFGQPMKDRVEAQKVAFLTQRLNLTAEEAQQFWPVFNEFTDKLQKIRTSNKPDKPFDEQSDADVEKTIAAEFDKEARELDLKKEYFGKLRKVISVKKIAKLYKAERDFRGELVKQLQEVRQMKKQLRQGNGN